MTHWHQTFSKSASQSGSQVLTTRAHKRITHYLFIHMKLCLNLSTYTPHKYIKISEIENQCTPQLTTIAAFRISSNCLEVSVAVGVCGVALLQRSFLTPSLDRIWIWEKNIINTNELMLSQVQISVESWISFL